jgi:hypothetical protein
MHLQGSNRSNSSMGFGAASTTIHHPAQGAGLLEVPMTLSGVPWLFSCSASGVLNGRSSEKLLLNAGSRECSLLSLVLYPKRVYFSSLMLTAEY